MQYFLVEKNNGSFEIQIVNTRTEQHVIIDSRSLSSLDNAAELCQDLASVFGRKKGAKS